MKKYLFLLALLFTAGAHAWDCRYELKTGFFRPSEKTLREIYGAGGFAWIGEVDFSFWDRFFVFAQGDYFWKGSRSNEPFYRSIELGGISTGIQYEYPVTCCLFDVYLGLGPKYFISRNKIATPNGCEYSSKVGIGAIAKGGFLLHLGQNFLVDGFAEYSYGRANLEKRGGLPHDFYKIDVGGLTFGAGVGYQF